MADEKDDWLDPIEEEGAGDQTTVLDQSDLDALFGDSAAQEPAAPPSAGDELDQSAIDALLGGTDALTAEPASTPSAIDGLELGQSDIDALLASPKSPGPALDSEPDQDEIDKLFSDIDSGVGATSADDNPFLAEDIDFNEPGGGQTGAQASTDFNFDAEEFKLDADIPDIPDSSGFDLDAPSFFADTVTTPAQVAEPTARIMPPEPEKESGNEAMASVAAGVAGMGLGAKIHQLMANRKVVFGVGGCVIALLIAVGVFWMKGRHPSSAPADKPAEVTHQAPAPKEAPPAAHHEPETKPATAQVAQHEELKPEPPPSVNAGPIVEDMEMTLPADSGQLQFTVRGKDPENDHLEYEFQSMPTHGQLSGHAPNLIYTPKPDFSSGIDSFAITATDGKNKSAPATITITRLAPVAKEPPKVATEPPPVPAAEEPKSEAPAEKKVAEVTPSDEVISAPSKSYSLTTQKSQVIDWKKLWSETNFVPYKSDVQVNIVTKPKHGSLRALDRQKSLYTPHQGFQGKDSFSYQFGLGTARSKSKKISLAIQPPHKEFGIQVPQASQTYKTGDTVVLNANPSGRGGVTFHWEQTAGVPVVLKPLNSDNSQISFVAPANFNTVSNPSLLFKVTATTQEGESHSKDIQIATTSRRTSAIWGGDQ